MSDIGVVSCVICGRLYCDLQSAASSTELSTPFCDVCFKQLWCCCYGVTTVLHRDCLCYMPCKFNNAVLVVAFLPPFCVHFLLCAAFLHGLSVQTMQQHNRQHQLTALHVLVWQCQYMFVAVLLGEAVQSIVC